MDSFDCKGYWGFKPHHCTESALLKVTCCLLLTAGHCISVLAGFRCNIFAHNFLTDHPKHIVGLGREVLNRLIYFIEHLHLMLEIVDLLLLPLSEVYL